MNLMVRAISCCSSDCIPRACHLWLTGNGGPLQGSTDEERKSKRPNYAMSGKAGTAASDALARSNSVVSTGSRRNYAYTMDVAPGKNTQRKQNQNFSVSLVSGCSCSSVCPSLSCSGPLIVRVPAVCLQQAPESQLCTLRQPDSVQPGVHALLAVLGGMLQQLTQRQQAPEAALCLSADCGCLRPQQRWHG